MKWYIGHTHEKLVAFKSPATPTEASHGKQFLAVVGPFKTKRGATWAEKYGWRNPHFIHVDSAEKFAMEKK